jgi:type IV secretion system protein VirB1
MTSLSIALVLQLAAAHAPLVAPETMLAFAKVESGLDPLAIHSNTGSRTYIPETVSGAVAHTRSLLARDDSIDISLLQINNANLAKTGVTVEAAFDPSDNIWAGAQIRAEAYRLCRRNESGEATLRCIASRYNTGTPPLGLRDGYVGCVWKAVAQTLPSMVPAIGRTAPPVPSQTTIPCGPEPPK